MGALFANGRIIDFILLLVLAEVMILIIIRKKTGAGLKPVDLIMSLLAGIGLLFALRAALLGLGWPIVALFLFLSLLAHLTDLGRRWWTAA
jgi:hypothetical protein